MTLIKSILLGSAAGIVAVASAQAADLPTKKAAPVAQYVKICNVGGITGWTMPGSDTCLKISGYMTAQFTGGNLNTQYNYASYGTVANAVARSNPALAATLNTLAAVLEARSTQRVLIQASDSQGNSTFYRSGDRLVGARLARVRLRLQHRLRPAARPHRHPGRYGQRVQLAHGYADHAEHHVCRPGLPDLGRDHRR